MNDLITQLYKSTDKTPAQVEALRIDNDLRLHKTMVETGLVGICHDLKDMRDRALYKELGYDSFEGYTENEHGIKSRQAYKYIRAYEELGEEILHSNANLGITKLDMLAQLERDEREALLLEHTTDELDATSTAEYKELLERYKKTVEQLSFLEKEATQKAQVEFDEEVEAHISARVNEESERMRSSLEAEIERLKQKAKDEAEKAKKATDEKKAADKLVEEAQKAKEEAEKAAKSAEEKAATANDMSEKLRAEQERNAAMEKQIKLSADPDLTRFKFMFEEWQKSTQGLSEQLKKLSPDLQEKMLAPCREVLRRNGL